MEELMAPRQVGSEVGSKRKRLPERERRDTKKTHRKPPSARTTNSRNQVEERKRDC